MSSSYATTGILTAGSGVPNAIAPNAGFISGYCTEALVEIDLMYCHRDSAISTLHSNPPATPTVALT